MKTLKKGLALGLYCYQCSTQFSDQFSFIEHLKTNELCKKMIRNVGLNYCFVCKKTYESVSNFFFARKRVKQIGRIRLALISEFIKNLRSMYFVD